MSTLLGELKTSIAKNKRNNHENNWDYHRFGTYQAPSGLDLIKDYIKKVLAWFGLYKLENFRLMQANSENLEWLFNKLIDNESKQLLIDLLSFRVMGHKNIKLPLNDEQYWQKLEELDQIADKQETIDLGFLGWVLNKYVLTIDDYEYKLFARAPAVHTQLILQQYRCALSSHNIEVEPGDIVIDAGACYGDTALYFANKTGPEGSVYSFEFMPENIDVFEQNLLLNPQLSSRINIVKNPLWSTSGMKLFVEGTGPASHITTEPSDPNSTVVETLCIDDLVAQMQLEKVNFIKMDIEGVELEALKGAQDTIMKYKPKLAISVYHNLIDYWTIPQWIDSLGLGYQFSMRHFTIHAEETILFARVED